MFLHKNDALLPSPSLTVCSSFLFHPHVNHIRVKENYLASVIFYSGTCVHTLLSPFIPYTLFLICIYVYVLMPLLYLSLRTYRYCVKVKMECVYTTAKKRGPAPKKVKIGKFSIFASASEGTLLFPSLHACLPFPPLPLSPPLPAFPSFLCHILFYHIFLSCRHLCIVYTIFRMPVYPRDKYHPGRTYQLNSYSDQ